MAMHCIIATPEMKELQKEFPKDSIFSKSLNALKGIIGSWQRITNNKYCPDKEELISYIIKVKEKPSFYLGKETVKGIKVTNIWFKDNENPNLSNFAYRPFILAKDSIETIIERLGISINELENIKFTNVEQAFQVLKLMLATKGENANKANETIAKILKSNNIYEIEKLGNTIGILTAEDFKVWDKNKNLIMVNLVYDSFAQNPKALKELLDTEDSIFTHTQKTSNYWKYAFPNILEEVRSYFQEEEGLPENYKEYIKSLEEKASKETQEEDDLGKALETKQSQQKEQEKQIVTGFHKIDKLLTSTKKIYRIKLINRLFNEIVENLMKEEVARLNNELAKATDIKTKLEIAKALKQMRPYSVIKAKNPVEIYNLVKAEFDNWLWVMEDENNANREIDRLTEKYYSKGRWAKLSKDGQRRIGKQRFALRKKKYQEILDVWDELMQEAAESYGTDWGVIIDIKNNSIKEDENNPFVGDEDNNRNEEFENEREESNYKEGYQTHVREISAFEGASIKLRQAIGNIKRTDWDGSTYEDDMGFPQYLQQSYVFAELITALKDMTKASQMLPMLEQLQQKKPWAKQIVDAIKNDDQLFTAFYRVFRKDYLNMWIQIAQENNDGTITFKTKRINRQSGLAHYFDEWRDNIDYGNVLSGISIYDKNGNIKIVNAKKNYDIIGQISRGTHYLNDREEKQKYVIENIKTIRESLLALGINITEETLKEVLEKNIDVLNTEKQLPAEILLEALTTIYENIPKNKAIKNNEPADLLNLYGSAFSKLVYAINRVEEDELESSVRQGKKTYYAHTRPSYFTTLVKKLKGADREELLNELREVDFLYDKNTGRWLNSILASLEDENEYKRNEVIKKLEHAVVLEHNKKEYNKWSELDAFLVLYNHFNSEPQGSKDEGYAFYASPVLSDKQSAEFIKVKRYNGIDRSVLDIISDKFVDVVRQEYNRIATVNNRSYTDNKKIPNYDRTKNKEGGAKFHFFPELNTSMFNKNGKTFLQQLEKVRQDVDEFNRIAKEAIETIMQNSLKEAILHLENIGLFEKTEAGKYKYFPKVTDINFAKKLVADFHYNAMYAQSQIIQLLGVDLAYFKNYGDFVKRSSAFHGSTDKLNTLAKWNGEYVLADKEGNVRPQRSIYLVDEERPSKHLDIVEEIIDERIEAGELTKYDKAVILGKWKNTNVTDAQAIRTLKSFRATSIAAEQWSDSAEEAYNNIRNGRWTAKDFIELWNTRKPFTYTQYNQSDGVGGIQRIPTIHKNSELIGLTEAIFGSILSNSYKMKGLMDFMESNDIDVAMFGSAVKVGGQAPINLNNAASIDEVKQILKDNVLNADGSINTEVVHETSFDDYGIQVATPEHGVGHVVLVGTQKRRLIGADISEDAVFEYNGRKLNKKQWRTYFNALNTANIVDAFEKVNKIFSNPKRISEILIDEIKNNSRYSNDLIGAVTLDETGNFKIPLFDPSQCQKIQELLNSIIRSKIVKQKINGAALILATSWCLNEEDRPQIVWDKDEKGNKRIKYIEAYVACPDENLYPLLLEEDGSININKKDRYGNYIVPEKYRHAIGYRIPTEASYSMVPIRIKGFLPRQVGSVIILPDEITTIAGLDFDVDKEYVEYQTLSYKDKYDIKTAFDSFYAMHPEFVIKGKRRKLEDVVKLKWNEFWNQYKDKFYEGTEVSVEEIDEGEVDFDSKIFAKNIYKQFKDNNTKNQRDNAMIELQYSLLTNSDTAPRIVNPGNFDELKRNARINILLEKLSFGDISKLGGIEKILNMTLREAEDALEKFSVAPNPLSPMTWVESQQKNMAGAKLVPIAAVQNSSHAITQQTKDFAIKEDFAFKFNGERRTSLHEVRDINNKLISRNVGESLTAFVDNGKDPVANDVGVNSHTHPLYYLFLRLGYSQLTAGLVMKQPAMKKILKYVGTGQYTFLDAIDKAADDYKNMRGNVPFGNKTHDHDFTDRELATNIALEKEIEKYGSENADKFANNQLRVLVMIKKMNEAASALSDVTRALRADTASGNVKSTIAASIEQEKLAEKILNKDIAGTYPLVGLGFIVDYAYIEEAEEIVNSPSAIPIAFHRFGLIAAKDWLSKLFPQASMTCSTLHDFAKGLTSYGRLDADTLNKMDSQFMSYLLTGYSKDFSGTKEERNYYINEFPMEFKKFKEDNEDLVAQLPLLMRLQPFYSTVYDTTPKILFKNTGKVTKTQSEQYRSDFRNLLLNEETSGIAKKLLIYSFYRGMYFRKDSFSSFLPTLLKTSDVTDYVVGLREIFDNINKLPADEDVFLNFLNQYVRNNLNDKRFVADVSATKMFIKQTKMPDTFAVEVTKQASKALKAFVYGFDDITKEPIYRDFIMYSRGKNKYYYQYDYTDKVYKTITPLGNKDYQEYQRGVNAETVIKKAEPKFVKNEEGYDNPYIRTVEPEAEISDPYVLTKQKEHSWLDDDFSPWDNPNEENSNYTTFNNINRSETDMEGNKRCK